MEVVKRKSEIQVYREGIMSNKHITNALDRIENKLIRSSIEMPEDLSSKMIRQIETAELSKMLSKSLPYIIRDLGIKGWQMEENQYEVIRFQSILQDYYADLTFKEIQLAFELLITGKLDDYLPSRSGQPDRSHYQQFSLEFVNKVLLGFRSYKNKVWKKVMTIQQTEKVEIEPDEAEERINKFKRFICAEHERYCKEGEHSGFIAAIPVYEMLAKHNLVPEIEVTDKDRHMAIVHVLNNVNSYEKKKVKSDPEHRYVKVKSKTIAMNRAILEAFEKIKNENKSIKELLGV